MNYCYAKIYKGKFNFNKMYGDSFQLIFKKGEPLIDLTKRIKCKHCAKKNWGTVLGATMRCGDKYKTIGYKAEAFDVPIIKDGEAVILITVSLIRPQDMLF